MNNFTQEQTKLSNATSTIFDDLNIVTEETFMVSIVNDIYKSADIVDVDDWIKTYESILNITESLNNNCSDLDNNDVVIETNERTSMHTMQAVTGSINIANNLYNLAVRGTKCSVCGKYIKYMPPNGFCSLECAAKDLTNRILSHIKGEFKTETPDIITYIRRILDYVDLCLNLVEKLPDLITNITKLPKEYKDYAIAKINIIFLYIKKVINFLLIKKNDLLIKLLKKMDDGTIDSNMMVAYSLILTVLQVIVLLREKMNIALGTAMKAISDINMFFYIGPLEYGFFMPVKSFMAICPFYKTDPTVFPASLIGQPFWGPGLFMIPFDMSKCLFTLDIGAKSALLNVDRKKIDKILRTIFRPITEVEYLMDPELFDVRLALSDLNVPAILKLNRLLEFTCVIGGDFLPTYANLKLTNIWFVIAILMCWGPTTRSIFGDFIIHGPL